MKSQKLNIEKAIAILFIFAILQGCTQRNQETKEKQSVFEYNQEEINDVKPWTSENFANKPENFQFVIIGDRTGGANAGGTLSLQLIKLICYNPNL